MVGSALDENKCDIILYSLINHFSKGIKVANKGQPVDKIEVLDADGQSVPLDSLVEQMTHHDDSEELLPALTTQSGNLPAVYSPDKVTDPLTRYIQEISRYKLLTPEEERKLTEELYATGDIEVAKRLVVANLRLVVKIALEYRSTYQNVLDLIQEGNIGLMKAVSKYDPTRGAKLSYYASWWIKSYILKFILDNFRMVKIGTTNEQKKLFFNLMKEKERLEAMGIVPDTRAISQSLGVSEKTVALMDHRLTSGGEISMDTPVSDDGVGTVGDYFADNALPIDEELSNDQELGILKEHLGEFLSGLKDRDREIFKRRLLSEVPESLQTIADEYGVSRERIRQIEERLLKALKNFMESYFA